MVTEVTEPGLIRRAKAGELGAFSELVQLHEARAYRVAWNILRNQEDAEDVLQNAFLKAFTGLASFEEHAKFYTWLVRIVVNEALMKLRKDKRGREVSLDEPVETTDDQLIREVAVWDTTPEDTYSREELRGILDKAIGELPAIYRAVFQLRDVDELSTEETAEALGLTIPAVKSRLLRARLKLRDALTHHFRRKGDGFFAHV
jgi:RNA polymerase sigma-70 factor (ECF subfamily)